MISIIEERITIEAEKASKIAFPLPDYAHDKKREIVYSNRKKYITAFKDGAFYVIKDKVVREKHNKNIEDCICALDAAANGSNPIVVDYMELKLWLKSLYKIEKV